MSTRDAFCLLMIGIMTCAGGAAATFFRQGETGGRILAALALIAMVALFVVEPYLNEDRVEPAGEPADPPEPIAPVGLSPDEIDAIVANMPEISPESRNHLSMLAKAMLREKQHGL